MKIAGTGKNKVSKAAGNFTVKLLDQRARGRKPEPRPPGAGVEARQRNIFPCAIQIEMNTEAGLSGRVQVLSTSEVIRRRDPDVVGTGLVTIRPGRLVRIVVEVVAQRHGDLLAQALAQRHP